MEQISTFSAPQIVDNCRGGSGHSPGAHLGPYRELTVVVTVSQNWESIVDVVRFVPQEQVEQRSSVVVNVDDALWEALNMKIRSTESTWT